MEVVEAKSAQQAFRVMRELKDFGGEEATGFIIKNLLAPLGIADSALEEPLFHWSREWGNVTLCGPNPNKWFAMWSGVANVDTSKRIREYEKLIGEMTRRLNNKLPKRIVIKHQGKVYRKVLRRLNHVCNQENLCMSMHSLAFVFGGRPGKLQRDARRV